MSDKEKDKDQRPVDQRMPEYGYDDPIEDPYDVDPGESDDTIDGPWPINDNDKDDGEDQEDSPPDKPDPPDDSDEPPDGFFPIPIEDIIRPKTPPGPIPGMGG